MNMMYYDGYLYDHDYYDNDYNYDHDYYDEDCYDEDHCDEDYYDCDSDGYEEQMCYRQQIAKMNQIKPNQTKPKPTKYDAVKLTDQCCKFLALNFPFAYLQDRFPPVPDELQLKVISSSFPMDEEKLLRYAALSSGNENGDVEDLKETCDTSTVKDMQQIGFRLSASVKEGSYSSRERFVTIHFDRGKITSAYCSCKSPRRIHHPEKLTNSRPISDSLYQLNKEQLLKFTHVLLHQHHNSNIVETAQDLLDKLINGNGQHDQAVINTMDGVPDLTSGPATGFQLSASVEEGSYNSTKKYVTTHSTNWCTHVTDTALARIRHPEKLTNSQLRLPISDSLYRLNKEQLLKFTHALLHQHQNSNIVETAQDLLDKLVNSNGQHDQAEINTMDGVPDPTSGPGLDEESHWFICSKGVKVHDSIPYASLQGFGFVSKSQNGNEKDYELLYNRSQKPIIKDALETEFYYNGIYGSSSTRVHESFAILGIIYELLEEDNASAILALTPCTEQVIAMLEEHAKSYRHKDSANITSMPTASLAMGFTARPLRCEAVCDELSRLWQLALLNPRLTQEQQQQLTSELQTWNEQVQESCKLQNLIPWAGLEVAINLADTLDWSQPDLRLVLECKLPSNLAITAVKDIHYSFPETGLTTSTNHDSSVFRFNQPFVMRFGSLNLDIHTWCSIIQALLLFNQSKAAAISLAFAVSVALVSHFRNHIIGESTISPPDTVECFIPSQPKDEGSPSVEKASEIKEQESPCQQHPCIWPQDTLLSVTTFAFLYDVLGEDEELVSGIFDSYSKQVSTSNSDILRGITSAESLRYQIGIMGLFLPKVPLATMQLEMEQSDTENWLCFELMSTQKAVVCCLKSSVKGHDDLLSQIAAFYLTSVSNWPLAPPSSLLRVILYNVLGVCLTEETTKRLPPVRLAVDAVLQCLGFTCPKNVKIPQWELFILANFHVWARLAELALIHPDDSSYLTRVMEKILSPYGFLGAGNHADVISRDGTHSYIRIRFHRQLTDCKCRISFHLAKAIRNHLSRPINPISVPVNTDGWSYKVRLRRKSHIELVDYLPGPSCEHALKQCAIRLGAHSVMLEKLSGRYPTDGAAITWLTEFAVKCGVEGVTCLITCSGDVSKFLHLYEALNLCTEILKVWNFESKITHTVNPVATMNEMQDEKKDDPMLAMVKEVLLPILKEAISEKSLDRISDIYSTCSETRETSFHGLVPWLSEHVQAQACKEKLPSEIVMFASSKTFSCFTHKLRFAIEFGQVDPWKGGLGLKRLFNEGTLEPEDDDDDDDAADLPNPYQTEQPHPYLDLAFSLGIMGLELLSNEDIEAKKGYITRYQSDELNVRDELTDICELVCYIGQKKWLHVPLKKNGRKTTRASATTGDKSAKAPSVVWTPSDAYETKYLMPYVTALLRAISDPMWLFRHLREISTGLFPNTHGASASNAQPESDHQIMAAVSLYPSLNKLLDKIQDAFFELLLGPEIKKLVSMVTRRRRQDNKKLGSAFLYADLDGNTLLDVLKTAKAAFHIRDPSGGKFKVLTTGILAKEPTLQTAVDIVLSGEEVPRPGYITARRKRFNLSDFL